MQQRLRRYRLRFYAELRELLEERGTELQLIHSNPASGDDDRGTLATLPWATRVDARAISIRGRELVWQRAMPRLREADLVVVEQASRLLLNHMLLLGRGLRGPALAYWGHGANFDAASASRSGEAMKRITSTRVHWWFAYTDVSADRVAALGYPRERITVVNNATDTLGLAREIETVSRDDVEVFRSAIRLTGTNVGLFLGSVTANKRVDYLLRAADEIRARVPDFELVVAGGGALRFLGTAAERPWIRWLGPVFERDLAVLLRVPKLMLIPSGVGLVIADTFAAGLPLVASSAASHFPEAHYLEDGFNGLFVDDGGDARAYAEAVAALLRDEERRQRLAAGATQTAGRLSAEDMAARFAAGLARALTDVRAR